MVLLIPGLALAPELYAAYQPHVSIYDPWVHSWTHADFEFDSPEQVTLIGHSLGGLVALEWALQFPERINALILLDPTFPALHTQLHSPRFSSLISQIASPFIPLALTPFVDRAVIQQRYRGKENVKFLYEQSATASIVEHRVAKLLKHTQLEVPTQILVGAGNRSERRFLTEQYQLGQILNAPTHKLWGEGHLFPLTHPELVWPFISQV